MPRRFIPIPLGSVVRVGDTPHQPADVSREMRNVFHMPGPRVEKRPPWASDIAGNAPPVTSSIAYMKWSDDTNDVTRLIAASGDIRVKDAVTESWAAPIVGAIAGVRDYANYQNSVWWMANDAGGVPQRYKYDGVDLDIDPFRERLSSETMCAWKNRIWMFNVYEFVLNRIGAVNAYGSGGDWVFTNVDVKLIVSNGRTMISWTPNNVASAKGEIANGYYVPASTKDTTLVLTSSLMGLAPLYNMPMSIEIFVSQAAPRNTLISAGIIRRPTTPNGFRYRAKVGGTTAVGEPVWNAAPGSETTDGGTVIWVNEGSEVLASSPNDIGSSRDNGGKPELYGVVANVPAQAEDMLAGIRIKFGTEARPAWELHPVVVGMKDGLLDGDPRKANWGQQLTVGRYFYDFFNMQTADEAAIHYPNRILVTEAGIPTEIRSDVYYDVVDGDGGGTVIRPVRNSLLAFKRDTITIYDIVEGPAASKLPVRYRDTVHAVGCLGPRAFDYFNGAAVFVGENEVYLFDGGEGSQPIPLAGEAMREAIFARDADWIEDQLVANRPILRVDEKRKLMRLYTQKGVVWVYSFESKKWASQTVTSDANDGASEIIDMAAFRNRMYVLASTNGPVREDPTATQDYVNGIGLVNVTAEMMLHPFEVIPLTDTTIETIEIHGEITAANGIVIADVSFDGGVTWPAEHRVTVPVVAAQPIVIPLWQTNRRLDVRLRHVGFAGADYFNAFWIGAWVTENGASLVTDAATPTTVSATL